MNPCNFVGNCWKVFVEDLNFTFFSSLEQTLHRYSLFITFDKIMNRINLDISCMFVSSSGFVLAAHKAHKPFEV